MIEVTDLTVTLSGAPVLRGITFQAGAGEFVAIAGPNGAGKTTLLRALAGILPGRAPDPKRIAYLPQGASCSWGLTLRQLASLGRIPHGDQDEQAVEDALAQAGVLHLAERRIDQVSGGQARRAHIARALATRPQTFLLDEPVADLDPRAAHDIMGLLAQLAAAGAIIIAVLHALDLACAFATRLVVVDAGQIVADGPPTLILPRAAEAFGMVLADTPPRPMWRMTEHREP